MGTETRIGIAAGLLLVVLASVYFFWGADRETEDLLVTGIEKPAVPVTAGPTKDKSTNVNAAAQPAEASRSQPAESRKNSRDAVARRSTPRIPPSAATANTPAHRTADASQGARPGDQRATGGDVLAAHRPTGGATIPASTVAANAPAATPLRSEASATLVEATRENLNPRPESASTPPAVAANRPQSTDLAVVGENIRRQAGLTPARPADRPVAGPAERPSTGDALSARTSDNADRTTGTPTPAGATPASNGPAADAAPPVRLAQNTEASRHEPARPVFQPTAAARPAADPVTRPPIDEGWPRKHVIDRGDTLSDISMRYYDTTRHVDDILKANPHVKNARALRIGDTLSIPRMDIADRAAAMIARLDAARADYRPIVPVSSRATIGGGSAAAGRPAGSTPGAVTAPPTVQPASTYTVREGDTFYSIARRVMGDERRWNDLLQKNRTLVKGDPRRLRPGMVLNLPR